jgi:dihydrofolate synthase/folylpolyglutamate synthase
MNFDDSLKLILKRGHGNKKSNLSDVKQTARALSLPALPFKIIHIAGTNGKGTTATLLAGALANAGFKSGLFISPHINDITERIQINGAEIGKKDFSLYVSRVLNSETKPLKFFEILTLAALLYFKDKKVDFAVIECGIGGLKDSTNIVSPFLSIITSVWLDHTAILGETIEKIAFQKAGVIKNKMPCIIGKMPLLAKEVICNIAKKKKSKIICAGRGLKIINTDYSKPLTNFVYRRQYYKLAALGRAQALNAAIVIEAARILKIPQTACAAAFKNLQMPSRFEVLRCGGKTIIKDGAHNPAALKEFIKIYRKSPFYKTENTLIYAASEDKDYKAAAKILAPHFKNIILTLADTKRGVPPENLKRYFKTGAVIPLDKLTKTKLCKLNGCIIITGSFYLCSKLLYK